MLHEQTLIATSLFGYLRLISLLISHLHRVFRWIVHSQPIQLVNVLWKMIQFNFSLSKK